MVFSSERFHRLALRSERVLKVILIPTLIILLGIGIIRWERDPGELFRSEQVRVGDWLRAHAAEGQTVFLEPIGYVGWASHLYIHDQVGLVSPRVLEYRRRFEGSDAWFLKYVTDMMPTYVVLQSQEISNNLLFLGNGDGIFRGDLERGWFLSHYSEVKAASPPGSDTAIHLVIYRLNDESRL